MPSSAVSPLLSLVASPASAVETDVLFLPVFEDEAPAALVEGLPGPMAQVLDGAVESREFQGKPYEIFILPLTGSGWRASRLAAIGCGRPADASLDRLRRVASAAALASRQRRFGRIAIVNRGVDSAADAAQALAEGFVLASYSGDRYKSGERSGPPAEQALIVETRPGQDVAALERAVERGRVLADSC